MSHIHSVSCPFHTTSPSSPLRAGGGQDGPLRRRNREREEAGLGGGWQEGLEAPRCLALPWGTSPTAGGTCTAHGLATGPGHPPIKAAPARGREPSERRGQRHHILRPGREHQGHRRAAGAPSVSRGPLEDDALELGREHRPHPTGHAEQWPPKSTFLSLGDFLLLRLAK